MAARPWKSILALTGIAASLVIMPQLVSAAAEPTDEALPAGWPVGLNLDSGNKTLLLTHSDGSVTAGRCRQEFWPPRTVATVYDINGLLRGTARSDDTSGPVFCDYNHKDNIAATDKYGNLYVAAHVQGRLPRVFAYAKDGHALWPQPAEVSFSCSVEGNWSSISSLTIGVDGNLYALARQGSLPGGGSSCTHTNIIGLEAATGRVRLNKPISPTESRYSDSDSIMAYKDGLILLHNTTVQYFDYSGNELSGNQYAIGGLTMNAGSFPSNTVDGRVFAITGRDAEPVPGCSGYFTLTGFEAYEPNRGRVWQTPFSRCARVDVIRALPNGGAATYIESQDGEGPMSGSGENTRFELVILDPNGVATTIDLPRDDSTHLFNSGGQLETDTNGNIVVGRTYRLRERPSDYGYQIKVYNGTTGNAIHAFDTSDFVKDWTSLLPQSYLALSKGRIYFVLGTSGQNHRLYALTVSGLGMDYPRGALFNGSVEPTPTPTPTPPAPTPPPAPVTKSFAVIGDSYSSGEGVPPFIESTKKDCHRSQKAYAKLLDEDARVPLQLIDFVACSGARTEHIYEKMQHSPYQKPQLTMLTSGVDLIFLTIGGNDVGFTEYAVWCFFSSCNLRTSAILKRIDTELPAKLDKTYAAIRLVAPRSKVYVVGYPHLMRPPRKIGCGRWDATEMRHMRHVTAILNTQIKIAADKAGFVFVNPIGDGSPFLNHELCTGNPYFYGYSVPTIKYSFHPNKDGQRAYADLIAKYLISK